MTSARAFEKAISGRYSADFTAIAAGSIIVALPVIVACLSLQRHFIRGVVSGALRE